jgi:hypothetical protein
MLSLHFGWEDLIDLSLWPHGPIIWALGGATVGALVDKSDYSCIFGGMICGILIGGYLCILAHVSQLDSATESQVTLSNHDYWRVEDGYKEVLMIKKGKR